MKKYLVVTIIILSLTACPPNGMLPDGTNTDGTNTDGTNTDGTNFDQNIDYEYENFTGSESLAFFQSDRSRSVDPVNGLYSIDEEGNYNQVFLKGLGLDWAITDFRVLSENTFLCSVTYNSEVMVEDPMAEDQNRVVLTAVDEQEGIVNYDLNATLGITDWLSMGSVTDIAIIDSELIVYIYDGELYKVDLTAETVEKLTNSDYVNISNYLYKNNNNEIIIYNRTEHAVTIFSNDFSDMATADMDFLEGAFDEVMWSDSLFWDGLRFWEIPGPEMGGNRTNVTFNVKELSYDSPIDYQKDITLDEVYEGIDPMSAEQTTYRNEKNAPSKEWEWYLANFKTLYTRNKNYYFPQKDYPADNSVPIEILRCEFDYYAEIWVCEVIHSYIPELIDPELEEGCFHDFMVLYPEDKVLIFQGDNFVISDLTDDASPEDHPDPITLLPEGEYNIFDWDVFENYIYFVHQINLASFETYHVDFEGNIKKVSSDISRPVSMVRF